LIVFAERRVGTRELKQIADIAARFTAKLVPMLTRLLSPRKSSFFMFGPAGPARALKKTAEAAQVAHQSFGFDFLSEIRS